MRGARQRAYVLFDLRIPPGRLSGFATDGPYCRSVREEYSARRAIGVELVEY